ncbi:lovastatin nonaketide synthase [Pseudomassariella vexata]|uniref:Lovastatin nonaketide synthase n=1 Tax=Pseudomassariella vexata TaxID=1141098 RepID=A0A1Y2DFI0_9PEZI|nr:lovastatin nonaketide synthase [Pseudomassariella vexata]ORY57854.1 lovastatin nonaketide synthase [Pseudomassariella vexata]
MTPTEEQTDCFPNRHGFDADSLNGACLHGGNYGDPISEEHSMGKNMPIAIVGMACRLPGSVSSTAEFWELCARARSGFSSVPKTRFNHDAFYHPNPGKAGAYHAAGGYFLDGDLAAFDAPFFGLTEKEAISMDPQQRLLLECTFEALENAGIPKHSIVGQDIGVFVGGSLAEYDSHLSRDSDNIPMHQATGTYAIFTQSTGFGRGEGCGIIILKPLDQALRDNDSIRAVIMGSGINQDGKTPGITMPNGAAQEKLINQIYRNAGLDPSDCGFVEAHGTGTKVGDPIEATAIHHTLGQGRSVKDTLYIGSVKSNIGHLEAASGIAAVIKAALMLERGFLLPNHDFKKPNEKIPWKQWHLKVPPTQRPWPKGKKYISVNNFGFGGTNAHVVLGKAPFPPKQSNGRATEKQVQTGRRLFVLTANDKQSLEIVMKKLVIYLEQRPEIFQNDLLNNLAYTLGQRRSQLQWRVAVPAMTSFDLIEALNSNNVSSGKEVGLLRIGFIFTGQGAQWYGMGRELLSQYPVYASAIIRADECLRRLGAKWSLFEELSRDIVTSQVSEAYISQPACTAVQLALTDLLRVWGILPVAVAGHSSGEIGAAYAAGFISFESAMSIAYHRGRLIPVLKQRFPTLDGAMMAVGATKDAVQPLIDALQAEQVRIACYNSPSSLTISGDAAALSELETMIEQTHPNIFHRRLQVDVAYHSHHMNLLAKEYRESIQCLPHATSNEAVRFHSSLYGRQVDGSECWAKYWVDNLMCPVRFSEALETMLEPVGDHKTGVNMLIELGPHSALQGPIKQILKSVGGVAPKIPYLPSLVRNKDAVETAMDLAASVIVKGALLQMDAINFPKPTKTMLLTDLPRYSWNHQNSYWQDSRMAHKHNHRTSPRSDLIGLEAIYSNEHEPTWRNIISLDDLPWLRHHQIQSVTVFPISGFIAMSLEAAAQWAERREIPFDKFELRNVSVLKPLAITSSEVEIAINLTPQLEATIAGGWIHFRICSWRQGTGWTKHCVGLIATQCHEFNDVDGPRQKMDARQRSVTIIQAALESKVVDVAEAGMYEDLSELGVVYGASFQGITNCKASSKYSIGKIAVANVAQDMPNHSMTSTIVHPTFLESMIQMYWPILGAGRSTADALYLPSSIGKLSISRGITSLTSQPGSTMQAYCQADFPVSGPRPTKVTLFATASEDVQESIIEIDDLTVSPIIDGETELETNSIRELCYKLEWEPVSEPPSATMTGNTTMTGTSTISGSLLEIDIAIIHGDSDLQYLVANGLALTLESVTSRLPDLGNLHDVDPKGKLCVVLTEIDEPFLANVTEDQFATVQRMLLAAQAVLWVTRGAYDKSTSPESNMISGLSRTVRSETLLPFATLDLDGNHKLDDEDAANIIVDIIKLACGVGSSATTELEFMERSGKLFTPRVINDDEMNDFVHHQTNPRAVEPQRFGQDNRPLRLEFSASRSIDKLHFVDDELLNTPLLDDHIEFEVKAVGMNSRDAALTKDHSIDSGHLAPGFEASGVITSIGSAVKSLNVGDRIAGLTTTNGAFATRTCTRASMAFAIPSGLSFEEASTLPLAYCTAYYSLMWQARLQKSHRVLIHSAGGGVGQAAIMIAQMVEADVFVTVGSAEKKALLIAKYNIPEDRIFYSRSSAFGTAVRRATDGEGVDVVLNLSPGCAETQRALWASVSRFGCLVDVAQSISRLETGQADSNASYISIDIFGLAVERPMVMASLVVDVARLLHESKIGPVTPITVFPISDIHGAFKKLHSTDRTAGRLVVVPHADDMVLATPSKTPEKLLRADSTYVLIGGTGGLGRSMAQWMASKGAGNIVLLSRRASTSGQIKDLVEDACALGTNIVVRSCNVADKASVDELFATGLIGLPPVRGVVHGAMVLHDVIFEKMTWSDYTTVIESKVQGAWNFHLALRDRNVCLDFFVAISSASGVVGNRGQAAYAAANTYLNALVQHRLAQGLPAASLDLTAVSDAGYLAEDAERAAEVARNLGSDSISEAEVLALLGAAITGRTATCNHQVITGMRITPTMKPFWTTDAKFKALRLAAEEAGIANTSAAVLSPHEALKAAQTVAAAEDVVSAGLVDKIAAVLMMEPEELDVTRSLSHYPLDSLVAIEIRNFITREFEANMQVLELLSSGSIQTLTRAVCGKSKLVCGLS